MHPVTFTPCASASRTLCMPGNDGSKAGCVLIRRPPNRPGSRRRPASGIRPARPGPARSRRSPAVSARSQAARAGSPATRRTKVGTRPLGPGQRGDAVPVRARPRPPARRRHVGARVEQCLQVGARAGDQHEQSRRADGGPPVTIQAVARRPGSGRTDQLRGDQRSRPEPRDAACRRGDCRAARWRAARPACRRPDRPPAAAVSCRPSSLPAPAGRPRQRREPRPGAWPRARPGSTSCARSRRPSPAAPPRSGRAGRRPHGQRRRRPVRQPRRQQRALVGPSCLGLLEHARPARRAPT